mmetsp:Transcript_42764/g.108172  ORF Transcript_42764/g.108172 Transcript_42764/m.108172 type:complete len:235 (+) Transcript_42764:332-1036(+)
MPESQRCAPWGSRASACPRWGLAVVSGVTRARATAAGSPKRTFRWCSRRPSAWAAPSSTATRPTATRACRQGSRRSSCLAGRRRCGRTLRGRRSSWGPSTARCLGPTHSWAGRCAAASRGWSRRCRPAWSAWAPKRLTCGRYKTRSTLAMRSSWRGSPTLLRWDSYVQGFACQGGSPTLPPFAPLPFASTPIPISHFLTPPSRRLCRFGRSVCQTSTRSSWRTRSRRWASEGSR